MGSVTLEGRDGQKITLPTGLFIHNKFIPSQTGSTIETYNPYTGKLLAKLAAAELPDVDNAVASATEALPLWKSSPPATRAKMLFRLADLIERDTDEFATIHAIDGGFAYENARMLDIAQAVETLRYFAGWADKITGKALIVPNGIGYTQREPIGVCAAIVPWNAPLMITIWKLAPALITGNVLIIKTPEITPLYGQKLARLVLEAGIPAGVVNIMCGLGSKAGQALAEHMSVRKIAFTGSTATGRSILKASAASNLKKVSLELGGKGPSLVFADANLENAIFWTSLGSSANNGQVCALGARIYVQEDIYNEFIDQFRQRACVSPPITGDPLQSQTTKGPIVSRSQHLKVLNYIELGKSEGAKLLLGGKGEEVGGEAGSGMVENTVFVDVREDMTIVKEEIFGPVATIHRFRTEEDAVRRANDSEYGLAAAIFTENTSRANRVALALEAGSVTINCWGALPPNMPFGGVKASGFGRDMGEDALEGWTSVKSIKHWFLDDIKSSL